MVPVVPPGCDGCPDEAAEPDVVEGWVEVVWLGSDVSAVERVGEDWLFRDGRVPLVDRESSEFPEEHEATTRLAMTNNATPYLDRGNIRTEYMRSGANP